MELIIRNDINAHCSGMELIIKNGITVMLRNGINNKKWDYCSGMELIIRNGNNVQEWN